MTTKEVATPPLSEVSFEDALRELEGIVSRMDDGTLSLEESVVAYRRGAELVRRCQAALESVRDQVQILDGEMLRPAGELFAERSADAG
ncbi:MAG: exodeoxyribonuclease VII small subunit [Burkholderiaceae bacterium]